MRLTCVCCSIPERLKKRTVKRRPVTWFCGGLDRGENLADIDCGEKVQTGA
jgi:hypothetical protein